jgi:hypothetical protein
MGPRLSGRGMWMRWIGSPGCRPQATGARGEAVAVVGRLRVTAGERWVVVVLGEAN